MVHGQNTLRRDNQGRNIFEKLKIGKIKLKHQQMYMVLNPFTGGFVLHVKQYVIIAMTWDIINQSAIKGPKHYIMYRTVNVRKSMWISWISYNQTWVEFFPRLHRM